MIRSTWTWRGTRGCRSPRLMSGFVRPLDMPELNCFAEACSLLQYILQGSDSRRTDASAVHTSDYALGTSPWLEPNLFVNQERATLIGLTCGLCEISTTPGV